MKNLLADRSPVRRKHAVTHLLITVLCFAFSVTATRLFLNLTGFPQLGGGELHIAHVLWGGLFLFIASLLPLIWVNPWVLELSALLSGLGVGLFIDEVGKFITSSNNYFHPSAAPIIYAFFLLTVLLFTQVKKPGRHDPRGAMYNILEEFGEVLDHDLSRVEYDRLVSQLNTIIQDDEDEQLVDLAGSLLRFLKKREATVVPHRQKFLERISARWQQFSSSWLNRRRFRILLIAGLLLWASWAVTSQTVMYLTTNDVEQFAALVEEFIASDLIHNAGGMSWFGAQILLEGAMGVMAFIAAVFFIFKKDRIAVWIGIADLVFTLVVVNLITFYFDQFSTIAFAAVQFLLLVLVLNYKSKFLDKK